MILRNLNKNNWFKKAFQNPFDFRFMNEVIDAINTTHDIAVAATPEYKVYSCRIEQKGAEAPSTSILQNSLGGTITWKRANLGIYEGTCTVPFTSDVTVWCSFTPSEYPCSVTCKFSNGKIELRSYDMAGKLADNLLIGSLEIRQY